MEKKNYTGLLYSQPTFLSGFARVFDLGGKFNRYNASSTGDEADAIAMTSDWYAITADLNQAIETFDPAKSVDEIESDHVR